MPGEFIINAHYYSTRDYSSSVRTEFGETKIAADKPKKELTVNQNMIKKLLKVKELNGQNLMGQIIFHSGHSSLVKQKKMLHTVIRM